MKGERSSLVRWKDFTSQVAYHHGEAFTPVGLPCEGKLEYEEAIELWEGIRSTCREVELGGLLPQGMREHIERQVIGFKNSGFFGTLRILPTGIGRERWVVKIHEMGAVTPNIRLGKLQEGVYFADESIYDNYNEARHAVVKFWSLFGGGIAPFPGMGKEED